VSAPVMASKPVANTISSSAYSAAAVRKPELVIFDSSTPWSLHLSISSSRGCLPRLVAIHDT
jgi:hypothetical protein